LRVVEGFLFTKYLKEYTLKLDNNLKLDSNICSNANFKETYKFFKNINGINIFEYLFLLKNLVLFLSQYSNTNFLKKFNINNTTNCLPKILSNLMYLQINSNKLSILPKVYKMKSTYKTHNTINFNIRFGENKFLSNPTTNNLKLKYKNLSKFFIHSNNYAHTSFFYYN
jgi:hypothetical protein